MNKKQQTNCCCILLCSVAVSAILMMTTTWSFIGVINSQFPQKALAQGATNMTNMSDVTGKELIPSTINSARNTNASSVVAGQIINSIPHATNATTNMTNTTS
jgi:hypothetical protein